MQLEETTDIRKHGNRQILRRLRCIDLSDLLSHPEALEGGARPKDSDGEWNR
jgi:hypothetical protein